MGSPTAWNINDKSDYLNVDGLRVKYTGEVIDISCYAAVFILNFCKCIKNILASSYSK